VYVEVQTLLQLKPQKYRVFKTYDELTNTELWFDRKQVFDRLDAIFHYKVCIVENKTA